MSSELKSFEFSKPAGQKKKALLDEPVKEQPVPLKETARDELKEPEKKEEDKPKSKYEQTELLAIFDEIIFSGEYAETVSIKGKLNIVFRTRTAKETEEIAQSLDSLGANLFATLEQKRSILNLTYSMVKYQTKDLLLLKKAEREEFIGRLPGPVIAALINALARFDEKVFEACREAEESFLKQSWAVQRTKLYVSGVKLPKLGSPQDRVLRDYLTQEAALEADRARLDMLNTLTNPVFSDETKARTWEKEIKRTWISYLSKLFNVEVSEETENDVKMIEYYNKVVKHLKPVLKKTGGKGYVVSGLDSLLPSEQKIKKAT